MGEVVLSSSYFPPVPWFSLAVNATETVLDMHEHYVKQTWRNRCRIITANGIMDLVVPVVQFRNHTPVNDIQVDYATNWKRVHHHAIRSAYGKSVYYEYYEHLFDQIFAAHVKPKFLKELNELSLELIREALHLALPYKASTEYIEIPSGQPDYRKLLVPGSTISPKASYIQTFQERHGFIAGLSIIDLLFCEGPDAINILNSELWSAL